MPLAGPAAPTLLQTEELRALVQSPLADEPLTDIIAREESWLAHRIGPLAGVVTQQFWLMMSDADSTLYLARPTDAVAVNDGGIVLTDAQVRLLERGTAIEKVLGYWNGTTDRQLGPVAVTYTPNDEADVKKVLIDLVRLAVSETGFNAETIGQYSYTRDKLKQPERLAASLMVKPVTSTIRLRSSLRPERTSSRSWWSWWP